MATFTKQKLSGSTDGKGIKITSNTGGSGTWVGGGSNTVEATNNSKMIEIKYAPSTGSINKLHYRLFGVA